MTPQYRSSQPAHWDSPRPHTDASQRFHAYGPIVPMQPDCGLRTWVRALGIAVLCAGLVVAVVLAGVELGL